MGAWPELALSSGCSEHSRVAVPTSHALVLHGKWIISQSCAHTTLKQDPESEFPVLEKVLGDPGSWEAALGSSVPPCGQGHPWTSVLPAPHIPCLPHPPSGGFLPALPWLQSRAGGPPLGLASFLGGLPSPLLDPCWAGLLALSSDTPCVKGRGVCGPSQREVCYREHTGRAVLSMLWKNLEDVWFKF